MKLFFLVFSILLLLIVSECTPQGQRERQRQRPRPRPRPRPGGASPPTNIPTNPTSTVPTTTAKPSGPPATTLSQQFFQCLQNCPTTSEYNPVCGSNQMVYQNMGKFLCAQNCGAGATFIRRGNCAGLF